MTDIGVGFYHRTSDPNVLDATWTTPRLGSKGMGTGMVRGDHSKGFSGKYVVTYYLPDGSEAGTYDVTIEPMGPAYSLSWSRNGEALYTGVGIETPEGLAIGFGKAGTSAGDDGRRRE